MNYAPLRDPLPVGDLDDDMPPFDAAYARYLAMIDAALEARRPRTTTRLGPADDAREAIDDATADGAMVSA